MSKYEPPPTLHTHDLMQPLQNNKCANASNAAGQNKPFSVGDCNEVCMLLLFIFSLYSHLSLPLATRQMHCCCTVCVDVSSHTTFSTVHTACFTVY